MYIYKSQDYDSFFLNVKKQVVNIAVSKHFHALHMYFLHAGSI